MITIANVTKKFGEKVAVDNLTLQMNSGSIIGFIGPNGAGKSTTLRMICGILKPDAGAIELNGYDIVKTPERAKEEFGFVSDNPDLFTALKGSEYINFICNIYRVPEEARASRLDDLLDAFEMRDAYTQKIGSYSHGMRQKIHIIATLMHDPNIWIMDEPMTGLDPQSAYLLKRRMREHADRGNTVLFSTHVLEVAEKLCDQIAIIDHGRLRYTGTLEALREQYPNRSLEEIFLTVTGSRVIRENSVSEVEGVDSVSENHEEDTK